MGNRFYRNISAALSGTQEYMAAEKLYELHDDERFDVVVVDTPPTRNALDFLEAPARLTRFLDHRLYRALTAPDPRRAAGRQRGRAGLPPHAEPGGRRGRHRRRHRLLPAFDGMEEGFRQRANAVDELLKSTDTAYVLVTGPRHDTIQEARYFARRLTDSGTPPVAVIVNRVHPRFAETSRTGGPAATGQGLGQGRAGGQPGRAPGRGRRRGGDARAVDGAGGWGACGDRPAARHRRARPGRPRCGGRPPLRPQWLTSGRAAHPDRRRRRVGHRRCPFRARDPGHHVRRLPPRPGRQPRRPKARRPTSPCSTSRSATWAGWRCA